MMKREKYKVVELYAGIGRSSEPFRAWRRATVSLLVDWNEHARLTFKHNHPRAPYIAADLSTMTPAQLIDSAGGQIDVLLGCPPCQGFSDSGKRDQQDPRNDHVLHFMQLAIAARPKIIAMENVPLAALSPQFRNATDLLEAAGYKWTAGVLNAALYGSSQSRHRLVLVAARGDLEVEPALPKPTHLPLGRYFDYAEQKMKDYEEIDDTLLGTTSSAWRAAKSLDTRFYESPKAKAIPTLTQVIDGLPRAGTSAAIEMDHQVWAHSADLLRTMEKVPEGGKRANKKNYYALAYARLHRHGLTRTITTYFPNAGSGRFWHPTQNRAITLREAARIQGVPDSFHFLNGATKANAILVGNALDASLANAKYAAIRRLLE